MSDAMTNREIEDVLTSIRRLVAQEGGRNTESGRLVLTEAQRVSAVPVALHQAPAPEADLIGPEAVAPATADGSDAPSHELGLPAPDFGRLEATIAELEAAVTASGGSWENEATGEAPKASNVTELYGRLSFVHRAKDGLAEGVGAETPATDDGAPAEAALVDAVPESDPVVSEPDEVADPAAAEDEAAEIAVAAPMVDEPDEADSAAANDGYDEGEALLDEDALRALVGQIVREELHGQLGERITLQVRKLVRAEIARALDERKFL